jgi:hypothetical protein
MNENDFLTFCGDEPSIACRVCGGAFGDASVSSGEGRYATSWRSCQGCGSWSVASVPVPERLTRFYVEYDTHHRAAAVNPDANDGRRYTAAFEDTRRREYGLGLDDIRVPIEPGWRVVDFGAQDGLFLDVVRAREPQVSATTAVDYVPPADDALALRGHTFETIDAWMASSDSVDLLTLWDVYEHIADLPTFMNAVRARLSPGGYVLVQTPMASLHATLLGPLWHHFLPVQHVQLPSRRGLVEHFAKNGFQLVRAKSFGANAPPSVVPQPYKRLFDAIAKEADLGSTQLVLFQRAVS